ncbi:DUF5123 domain-containing protein [Fulvivirga ligni]|uniref:DUF5123 domain-containing protein n=1 Tax=Fulvivirga ligni TaxID=2904246 RepID=UPI001F402165|nr:DUF5123 domain-containing protein [Fulvivirga ligni]UII23407.1 fibronectin type III domain-containing protein [Fulvivirga ligni]
MKKSFKYIFLAFGLLPVIMTSCSDDIDPVITELDTDRAFAPVGLTAFVRNQTTIELKWDVKEGVDHYEVEFSQDSLEFNSIIRTVTVMPDEVPIQEAFEGETQYSARVKAVREDGKESGYATIAVMTAIENIFLPLEGEDIAAKEVTLKWPAGSEVTHLIVNPGNVNRTITADEKAAGEVTIEGLTGETEYTITLYNNTKRRGVVTFETLVDIGDAIAVHPEDDLLAMIAAANDGDVLVLFPGEYGSAEAGLTINIEKSIKLRGLYPYDRPVVYGQITCNAAVGLLEVRSIIFEGTGYGQFFNVSGSDCNVSTLTVEDCDISGYSNNLIYNNNSGVFGTININNCYIHDILGSGGDGIDFRSGEIGALNVTNSTFANGFRTFLRMQAECNSVFESCTFYQVANVDSGNNRGLFRSSGGGTIKVSDCLFVRTGLEGTTTRGWWTKAGDMSASTTYADNYFFNVFNLFADGSEYTDPAQVDATELDPGFVDAANEDFTVTNQTLIDEQIGDPRWLN